MSENIEGALPVRMREAIAGLPRYKQGKAPREGGFKLSSNENPFEPLPGVIEAVLPALAQLNRYPDAQANELRDVLAARHGITREQIHVTPGSVAALQQVVAAATGPGDEVVYPWRSFEAYPWLVLLAGATGVQVPNLPDHSHDLGGIKAAITPATRVVILCTPNNPTGTIVTLDQFRDFMASVPSDLLVILDEAYFEFNSGEGSFDGTALLGEYPNLVVLRTFSKAYGLAGLRIGYAMGREDVMDVVRNAATPLALTDIAAKAALASLAREDELLERVRHIARIRHELWEALIGQGWDVPEPHGNFLWLTTGADTARIAATLEEAGIVVRAFPPEGLRISIGEYEAVGTLLTLTAEIVTNLPVGHPARR